MLKTDYDIPIFKDEDVADLNEYSNEMASALKTQLDKFGNPLKYKGQIETIQNLPSDAQSGDIYSITTENKNYIWNGTGWVEYASTIDLTELENKTIVDKTKISGSTSQGGTPSPINVVPIENVNISNVDSNGYGTLTLNMQKDTDIQTVTFTCKRLHQDDYIDEWGFHYNRKTLVLDGTETWKLVSGYNVFYFDKSMLNTLESEFICNSYAYSGKVTSSTAMENNKCYLFKKGNNVYERFYFKNTNYSTVDEWKAYLAEQYANGTPLKLEFKLETTEDEEFDTTNQTAWNTLEGLLIQGYTFVNSSSDELQPAVNLTEYTSNEIYRENIEKFKELDSKIDIVTTTGVEFATNEYIDGKRVYGKRINFGALPNATERGVKHGIADLPNNIINVNVIVNGENSIPIPYASPTSITENITYRISDTYFTIITGSDRSNLSAKVILEYTKTTD